MDKLIAVVKREYLERVRSRWFIIATLFGPVFFLGVLVVPALLASRTEASEDVASIAILDATGTELGTRIAAAVTGPTGDTAAAQVVRVAPAALAEAESLATARVIAEELQGYLVLDDATLAGTRARYAGRNASTLSDVERLRDAVRQTVLAVRLEQRGVAPTDVAALTQSRLALDTERLSDRGRGSSGMVNAMFGIAVTFILYMSILLYGMNVLRGVQEEKQTRVAEVVLSSVRADTLLAGKVLGIGAVGLTQLVIWSAAGILLFRFRTSILTAVGAQPGMAIPIPDIGAGSVVVLLLFFLLGYTLYSSLLAAVGAMTNSDQEAQQAAQPVILLLVFAIIFLQAVLQNPNSRVAEIVSWIPFTAPVIMPLRMSLTSVPAGEVALVLLGMAVTCALVVWLAARIYRVGLLMYGKRPSMGELFKWVRYAG